MLIDKVTFFLNPAIIIIYLIEYITGIPDLSVHGHFTIIQYSHSELRMSMNTAYRA